MTSENCIIEPLLNLDHFLFYFGCHKMTPKSEAQEKRKSTL